MKKAKIVITVLLLVLVALGVFVWTLPADVAYRFAASRLGPVTLSGLHGTLWSGHADGVSILGNDLGELDWHLDKIPLLRRQVIADLGIRGADVDAAGVLERDDGGRLGLRDVRFRFPAVLLEPALGIPALKLLGTVSGTLARMTLDNGMVAGASGSARWSEAGVAGQAEARFGDLLADFASAPDDGIAGTVHDDGQGDLEVNGTFGVRATGFDVEARLAARNADPRVLEMLRYVGEAQPDGSSKLLIHGQLFKLF